MYITLPIWSRDKNLPGLKRKRFPKILKIVSFWHNLKKIFDIFSFSYQNFAVLFCLRLKNSFINDQHYFCVKVSTKATFYNHSAIRNTFEDFSQFFICLPIFSIFCLSTKLAKSIWIRIQIHSKADWGIPEVPEPLKTMKSMRALKPLKPLKSPKSPK